MRRLTAFICVVLLHACAAQRQLPARPIVKMAPTCKSVPIHLSVLGDSLARGWGASRPSTAFASLVYSDIRASHPGSTLENLGIPGATSDEIATKEISHVRIEPCSLIVVISGANDVQRLYTPAHFRSSYLRLLGAIRTREPHAVVVVIGLPNVALSPLIPWILKPAEAHLSRAGNLSIAEAARRNGAAFVPLYAISERNASRATTLLSRDRIHPNDRGYRIMAAAALPVISSLL